MLWMYICNSTVRVERKLNFRFSEFKVGWLWVSNMGLHVFNFRGFKRIIDGFPKASVSNIGVNVFLFYISILNLSKNTIASSMRYRLTILLCWKWGSTKLFCYFTKHVDRFKRHDFRVIDRWAIHGVIIACLFHGTNILIKWLDVGCNLFSIGTLRDVDLFSRVN